MAYFTFKAEFNAVHKLWNATLDDEHNFELFAECANPAGHGHLYCLEVTVRAPISGRLPVVIERGEVRRVIEEVLTPLLQDADMNTVFEKAEFISTGENIVKEIWQLLSAQLPDGVELAAMRMASTPNNSFAYFGGRAASRALSMI